MLVVKALAAKMLTAKQPRTFFWILDVVGCEGESSMRMRDDDLGEEKEALVLMIRCCCLENNMLGLVAGDLLSGMEDQSLGNSVQLALLLFSTQPEDNRVIYRNAFGLYFPEFRKDVRLTVLHCAFTGQLPMCERVRETCGGLALNLDAFERLSGFFPLFYTAPPPPAFPCEIGF